MNALVRSTPLGDAGGLNKSQVEEPAPKLVRAEVRIRRPIPSNETRPGFGSRLAAIGPWEGVALEDLLIFHQGDEAHAAPAALACDESIAEGATEKLKEGAAAAVQLNPQGSFIVDRLWTVGRAEP